MKIIELVLIVLFALVFLQPRVFSRYARTIVGKLVLLLSVVSLGLTYGVRSAVIMTCISILLFESRLREGMENNDEIDDETDKDIKKAKEDVSDIKDEVSAMKKDDKDILSIEEDLKSKESHKNDPSVNVSKKESGDEPKSLNSSESVENFAMYQ
jgi:hypothetical protein